MSDESRRVPRPKSGRVSSGASSALALVLIAAVSAAAVSARTASAQAPSAAGPQRATRSDLARRIAALEAERASGQAKGARTVAVETELATLRNRLEVGDFRVGDRFVITLRRDSVKVDTASLRDSMLVSVFNLPDVSLRGVLRSELDERMSSHVARFLRGVSVRTGVFTRVAVLGAVRSPGYYYISPDRPVSDLVMLAGGPTGDSNLNEVEVTRGTTLVVRPKDSRRLLKEGRTLEELDVQSGDEVRIPTKKRVNWQLVIQSFFIISSLFFASLQFLQWYYSRQNQ
jgi:hypothetical protein